MTLTARVPPHPARFARDPSPSRGGWHRVCRTFISLLTVAQVFLIEHHGKELLASHGFPVPAGVFVPAGGDVLACAPPDGPVMVQSAGRRRRPWQGRRRVERAASRERRRARIIREARWTHVERQSRSRLSHRTACRVRAGSLCELVGRRRNHAIRLLVSAEGGVDVEAHAADENGALNRLGGAGEFGRRCG